MMTSEEKKAFLLLASVIFHYHGLDEEEKEILNEMVSEMNADREIQWVNEFISTDYVTAYQRSREFFSSHLDSISPETRLRFLSDVWQANLKKGYITEMEAMAIITLAKDWDVEKELIKTVRS